MIETGDSFHQDDSEFAQTVAQNTPAMNWMARAADAPYERAFGPDISTAVVNGGRLTATAVAADTRGVPVPDPSLASAVASTPAPTPAPLPIRDAEWFTNPATTPGSGHALRAIDGAFDTQREAVSGPITGARDGQLVWLRARDMAGNWGASAAVFAHTDAVPDPASTPA